MILEKLTLIQSELKAPKSQKNTFGNYKYRSCEDICEALKPILKKYNCTLFVTDEMTMLGTRFYCKAHAIFSFEGKQITVNGYAREEETKKGMDGSQITGASSSYARKYALNGLFLIDDTKDSDSTNTHGKEVTTSNPPPAKKAVKVTSFINGKEVTEQKSYARSDLKKISQEKFKTYDEFTAWRVEKGLAENKISMLTDQECLDVLKELVKIK